MTRDDLVRRGFVKSYLPTFYGFCPFCGTYRGIEWWVAMSDTEWKRRETTACQHCGRVDRHDESWITREYPATEQARVA